MNRRLVPIADWIRSYQREWLRRDLIAGVIVTALIVPKNLGYAGIAGIPLQNGLYAAAAGAVLYAIFGTCRQISMGPSSGLAAVAAAAVLAAGISGEQDVATFVAGITLVSGLLFVLLAVFRMGWIAQFLSRAVVTGFLFGAAIDVVIGELPKLTGTDVSGDNSFQELRSWFGSLAETSGSTLVVGAVALIVVFGLRRVAPRVPGALVLVVGGLLASWVLDLEGRGVAVVGTVPRGLPAFDVPDLGLMWDHVVVVVLAGSGCDLDRVLTDRRRRQGIRRQAPLPGRHQPGVGGAGHGQHGCGAAAGHACLDQLVGELAQRPLWSADGARLPHLGRHGAADPARPRAALL